MKTREFDQAAQVVGAVGFRCGRLGRRKRHARQLPTAADRTQQVQEGLIVATGVGDPLPDVSAFDEEPWKVEQKTPRFRPMQARVGDHAIFFRKAAVEISFEDKRYLVVPQAAILVLVRDDV